MNETTSLESPFINVDWEDTPDSFTPERIGRIKSYFIEKYHTKNVRVRTIAKTDNTDTHLKTLEVSDSILDTQYQKKIMKEFITQQKIEIEWDLINRLDDKVNGEIDKVRQNHIRYNKWFIKKIEFSNFLSYGEGNVLDFTELGGITVIESDPPNFGGKTVLAIDLLMFLLFNTTTKAKTAGGVFNKFTDKNEVIVRGYLEIDGTEYIIDRTVTRKKSKAGEWKTETELTFKKKNSQGVFENETGEQRTNTEKYIKSAIGDHEDFLTTILTTANNLEELLEAKPTARGLILTRFLGLESLKQKEEICKKLHSDWSKKLLSNQYNIQQLKSDSEIRTNKNEELRKDNILKEADHHVHNGLHQQLIERKETLLVKQHNDIDSELVKMNPIIFKREIESFKDTINTVRNTFESIVVKEPSEYYHQDLHEESQMLLNKVKVEEQLNLSNIKRFTNTLKQLVDGGICPTCNRKLEDVDHSAEINTAEQELGNLIEETGRIKEQISIHEQDIKQFNKLKKEFDDYDKDKLRKERYSLEVQQKEFELKEKEAKLLRWEQNKNKLEENTRIEKELVEVKTKIETEKAIMESITNTIRNNNQMIESNTSIIETNKGTTEKIKKEEKVGKVFETYMTIFGKNGISKMILKSMIPLINQELQRILADTCYFTLAININEKNEVEFTMIDNDTRVENDMPAGSGYEKTVASLALRAVLTKISSLPKPNIVVMDEIFGKIADGNLDMVSEFFVKIKSYFEHIFLISHNPLIKNWADNVILIKKEEKISRIV